MFWRFTRHEHDLTVGMLVSSIPRFRSFGFGLAQDRLYIDRLQNAFHDDSNFDVSFDFAEK